MKSIASFEFACSPTKEEDVPSNIQPSASFCRPTFASLTRCFTSNSLPRSEIL